MDPFQTSIVTPLLPCHPPDSFWVPALLGGGKAAYDQVPDKVGTGSGCMVGAPDRLQAGEAKTRVKGADPYWIEGPGGPAAGRPPYSLLPDPYLYHSPPHALRVSLPYRSMANRAAPTSNRAVPLQTPPFFFPPPFPPTRLARVKKTVPNLG